MIRRNELIAEHAVTGMTLRQIGDKFGISRERVRQILGKTGRNVREGYEARIKSKRTITDEGCWLLHGSLDMSFIRTHRRALGVEFIPYSPVKVCKTDGCFNPAHYVTRWSKAHINSKVEENSVLLWNGCRKWTGPLSATGYPWFSMFGDGQFVHRVVWEAHNGEIPDGLCVIRTCESKLCVAIDHMSLGTRRDAGRHGPHVGSGDRPMTDDEIYGWVLDFKSGMSIRQVMEKYERPYTYVAIASSFLRKGRTAAAWNSQLGIRIRRWFEAHEEWIGGPKVGVDTARLPAKCTSVVYTKEVFRAVVEDLRGGMTIEETAKKHGLGKTTVGYISAVLQSGRECKSWKNMNDNVRRLCDEYLASVMTCSGYRMS